MVQVLKQMQRGDLEKLRETLTNSNLLDAAIEHIAIAEESKRLRIAELLIGLGADPTQGLETALEMRDGELVWFFLQRVDRLPHRQETLLNRNARIFLLALANGVAESK